MTNNTTATSADTPVSWDLLLQEQAVLIHRPGEKIGVYAGPDGIVIMAEDSTFGLRHIPIDLALVPQLLGLIAEAQAEAVRVEIAMEAEYAKAEASAGN